MADGVSIISTNPAEPTPVYSAAAHKYSVVRMLNAAASAAVVHWVVNGADTGDQTPPGAEAVFTAHVHGPILSIAAYVSASTATVYPNFVS